MISKECFTREWIETKSEELHYNDKNIIEKVIRALSLLDMLASSGCPFHFKGGSCLLLLLKDGRPRLSIDIDIICPPGAEVEPYLQKYKEFGFIDYKPTERIQRSRDIPKTHSKFFYNVAFLDDRERRESILLDVLNEDCHYEQVLELPVESPMVKIEGPSSIVKVPSVGDILGDKLTAFAPNTTGIPYCKSSSDGSQRDCSMEIIKQLYDISRLFEAVENLSVTSRSFRKIAKVELSYRGMEDNPGVIFDDIRNTSLCLATRGAAGNGNFDMLQNGIFRIKSFMFRGGYRIEDAVVDSARAAYIATMLETGNYDIERYSGDPLSIAGLTLSSALPSRLVRLKRQSPEAFYYWAKTGDML